MQRPVMSQAARPSLALPAAERWSAVLWSWLPALALLLGLGLRLSLVARPGLHPDEALYASWALRIADGSDPALLGVEVDKPPLTLYVLAAVFRLAGVGSAASIDFTRLETLGKLAGVVASALSLVLVYGIARQVYDRRVARLALLGWAVSPLAVRLSPTLFTDPWLVLWVLLGLWAAVGRRAWLTGLACGLAYAAKQQALFFLPLIVGVFVLGAGSSGPATAASLRPPLRRRQLYGLVNGFLLLAALVLWWDSLRWQWRPSYWERSLAAYGALGPLAPQALPAQARQWAELLGYVLGSPLLTASLAVALAVVAWTAWRQRSAWAARFDRLLLSFVAAYLGLHLLTTIAPWDRYALALAPLLILLWARGVAQALAWAQAYRRRQGLAGAGSPRLRGARWLLLAVATAAVLQAAALAAGERLPVGDRRAYDAAPAVAAYLRQPSTAGAVLYHHWLGWHYAFYLYGAAVELRWWETPQDLAAEAAALPARPQFVAIPAGRASAPVANALAAAGVRMEVALAVRHADGTPSLTLYRLHAPGDLARGGRPAAQTGAGVGRPGGPRIPRAGGEVRDER